MNRTGHVVMVSLSSVSYLIPRSDISFSYELHCPMLKYRSLSEFKSLIDR